MSMFNTPELPPKKSDFEVAKIEIRESKKSLFFRLLLWLGAVLLFNIIAASYKVYFEIDMPFIHFFVWMSIYMGLGYALCFIEHAWRSKKQMHDLFLRLQSEVAGQIAKLSE